MQILETIAELRAALAGRDDVALVPTMGSLHEGHLSLARLARERGGTVVASIFVNPLQFAPHEDFASYPRTLERDCAMLRDAGCDIVFAPNAGEMYPEPQGCTVHPPAVLADILEGAARPGFFVGVCTVVLKLFHIVAPRFAVFGKKDYQQLLVVRNMVRQFALPIEIVPAATVRDASGLALSSRNAYLSGPQRAAAAELYAGLRRLADAARGGRTDWQQLESEARAALAARGWLPDYVAVRTRSALEAPVEGKALGEGEALVVLAAARLGPARLIDNLEL
jgi:pantoate--beta-alanine ligase